MRIAFHVPRASSLRPGSSGDKTNVQNLLAGLTARGHEVSIVSHVSVRDFWRGRVGPWRLAIEAARVRRKMKRFAPHAWLVYGASVTDADLFGWWLCRGRYVHVHARAGRGTRLARPWRALFRTAHLRSLARADGVAAERPPHAEDLRRSGVLRAPLYVLPSPAGVGATATQADARSRLSLPHDARIVLCVTRLPLPAASPRAGKTEGVLALLAGFAELPRGSLLLVVGDGDGRPDVEEQIARLGLASRVRLAGSVAHEEMTWFYAASDFYAYPLTADRPFVAIGEAQAAGRPVVAMRSPSTEAIVADGRSGLLADDLGEFVTHMATLASDSRRCVSMGQAARDYVAAHHSVETRIRQIEALLRGTDGDGLLPPPATEVF